MVEYYEDVFEDDPYAVLDSMRGADGEVVFEDVGDPLIDKWEKEIAQGLVPDLEEGLSEKEKEKLKRERSKSEVAKQKSELVAEINDDFRKERSEPDVNMKQFESKFVAPGSAEDRALRRAGALGRSAHQQRNMPDALGGGLTRGRR